MDETLGLIERGRLEVPEDVALKDFVVVGDQQDRPVVGFGRGSGRKLLQYNASPTSIWQLLVWKTLNVDRLRDHHTVRLLSVINLVCVGDRGVIYFIHDRTSRTIKIGCAWDPKKRLSSLQISTSNELVLLGSIGGMKRAEKQVPELVHRHCARQPVEP